MAGFDLKKSVAIISVIQECFKSLTIVLYILVILTNCNVIVGPLYTRNDGFYETNEPFRNLSTVTQTSYLVECEEFVLCRSVNIVRIASWNEFNCQLFNCSNNFDNSTVLKASNTTLYKLERSQKGTDCQALLNTGVTTSGVYLLTSWEDCSQFPVYCDMTTEKGGWIMLQRRFDGSVEFNRTWNDYKSGFGNLSGEFWLGLEYTHQLMKEKNITMRFDMWYGAEHAYMTYYDVTISDEVQKYTLDWQGTPTGNAGDSMGIGPAYGISKSRPFSTHDIDNDDSTNNNCAADFGSGWWHKNCFLANLNGKYNDNNHAKGIVWNSFKGYSTSLTKAEIKIKRIY